ncbi:hypothetical protein FOMPIDRAFT_1078263, partial [Fomitopsis schrenkii]
DLLKTMDSSGAAGGAFEALHFSWYNRHSTKGHDTPSNVQPTMLKRSGRSRTNHNQFVPYMSKDVTEHATTYQLVKDILRDVFDWLARKASYLIDMEGILPYKYSRLEATTSILPDYNMSAVRPFVGLVLNFNIASLAHRDAKDDGICLVMPLGDFVGGTLCLVEPGIVLPLRHGDFTMFRSCDITHFNLHY